MAAFVARFLDKGDDYDNTWSHLGSKGQFADINRKFWKLKRAVWDEKELTGEPLIEVIQDLLGHLFLLLETLEMEQKELS